MIRGYIGAFPTLQYCMVALDYFKAAHYAVIEKMHEVGEMGIIKNIAFYSAGIATIVLAGRFCGADDSQGIEQRVLDTRQYMAEASARIDAIREKYCPDRMELSLDACVNYGIQQYVQENAK